MQITLSGKLMHVTPPLNVLDRDTLPYVRLHIHTLSSLRTGISLTQVETSHFHFNENRKYLSSVQTVKNKELSESFHYDHSLLYSESWTNILRSHSLSINLGNRHYFNSLPELDLSITKKTTSCTASLKPRTKENKIW
jgi:hypothetical protein